MENNILVSIIMSEYNTDEMLLKESIRSMLEQTYKNFEFIIVDDKGRNNLKEIVKSFNDERIKIVENEKNEGLVYSLNRAIEEANGKYLVRMDTDDFSYNDRLKKQVDFMEQHPEYAVVGTRVDYYDGVNVFAETKFCGEVTKEILSKGPSSITHPSVIMRKDVIKEVGCYQDYNRCEDYALWIELILNGYRLYVMEDKLLRYHLSLSDYSKRKLSTRKGFFKLLREKYRKLNPSITKYYLLVCKTFIAGIVPYKIMAKYHEHKYEIKE